MKLRGLLKSFSIFGLSILPVCFTSAVNYYENVGDYEDLGGNNNCTIKSDLSFDCSESNNVIVGTDMSWFNSSSSYFWTNSGLAMYIHLQNGNDYQGLITSFKICDSDNVSMCNTQISYQDFLTYASNYELTQWRWYSVRSTPGWAGIDFLFGTTHIYFGPEGTNDGDLITNGNYTPYNFGLYGWGLDANYTSATNSPFVDYSVPDSDVIIWDGFTGLNKNYIDLFKTIGFYSGLCYSDFTLNNIVDSNTTFYDFFQTDLEDGEPYTGATIFDLSNHWFTPLNFTTYFSNANAVYKAVNNNNDRISIYSGLSKGQFREFFKLNNAEFIDTYTLNSKDVYCYCDMVVNGYDPNGIFNCDISVSAGNIKDNVDYLKENDTNFVLSGANDDNVFESGADMLSIFNKLYSRFKQAFPVDERLSSNTVGILPGYVIFGFFMFLLLYVLKR